MFRYGLRSIHRILVGLLENVMLKFELRIESRIDNIDEYWYQLLVDYEFNHEIFVGLCGNTWNNWLNNYKDSQILSNNFYVESVTEKISDW